MFCYLVVVHVFAVPVILQPVLGSVLLDKIIDSVSEVVGLQQQQLDYEVANLSLISLVATHRLEGDTYTLITLQHGKKKSIASGMSLSHCVIPNFSV